MDETPRRHRNRAKVPAGLSDRFRLDRLLVDEIDKKTGRRKHGFETVAKASDEDLKRSRSLQRVAERAETMRPFAPDPTVLKVRQAEALALSKALEIGVATSEPPPTLASYLYMRGVRLTVIGALLKAAEQISNEDQPS